MRAFAAGALALAATGMIFAGGVQAHDRGHQQGYRHARHASDEVRQVQQRLEEQGYHPGPVDGVMGSHTRQALRQFQQAQNIHATGHLDAQTLAALKVESGKATSGTRGMPGTGTPRTVSPGASGSGTHPQDGTEAEGGGMQGYRGPAKPSGE